MRSIVWRRCSTFWRRLLDVRETLLDVRETLLDGLETLLDVRETLLDGPETQLDGPEALLDLPEADLGPPAGGRPARRGGRAWHPICVTSRPASTPPVPKMAGDDGNASVPTTHLVSLLIVTNVAQATKVAVSETERANRGEPARAGPSETLFRRRLDGRRAARGTLASYWYRP